ncbi:MAG: polysaccharide biosynthesis/export family protein [Rikenellaceae bacterium]
MQKRIGLFLIVAVAAIFSSCGTYYKQVPYLQNSDLYEVSEKESNLYMYDARIMPKDLITITVSTSDPTVAMPFNLTVPTVASLNNSTTSQPILQKYLVDNEGNINFPIVGELQVGGLTKGETEKLIVTKLKAYLKETPIVSVRMTNYNISVLGEVSKPGTFTIDDEKITIFEALAMAGDMTVYGQRQNIKLIREDASGMRKIIELDITSPEIITSPYYYLQQNDVLYVTPNKVKARTAGISTSTTIWFSVSSALISLATLMVSILL